MTPVPGAMTDANGLWKGVRAGSFAQAEALIWSLDILKIPGRGPQGEGETKWWATRLPKAAFILSVLHDIGVLNKTV